jgi:hypothetical protein
MKAEELRKGNWVGYYGGTCEGKILGMKFSEFSNDSKVSVSIEPPNASGWAGTDLEDLTPVLLTDKNLIDLGAKGRTNLLWLPIYNLKAELHFECHASGEIVTTLKSQFCDLILDRIKYVHNLQNLYHALSGEELPSAKTEA